MKPMFLMCLLSFAIPAFAQTTPPIPYYDWGACPFECCTYRTWGVVKPVVVHRNRSSKSKVAFTAKNGDKVEGITGVVITTKYGVTKVVKEVKIGYQNNGNSPLLSLKPGDEVYTLHYLGEGFDLFWYKGKTYSDQISIPENAFGNVPFAKELKVESHPATEWWVKVKNLSGAIGWTDQVEAFDNLDACG